MRNHGQAGFFLQISLNNIHSNIIYNYTRALSQAWSWGPVPAESERDPAHIHIQVRL